MNAGIYAIEHVASGQIYIGSAQHFRRRWEIHRCLLRKGNHHSRHLQRAWSKYGEASFVFKKLLICSNEMLLFYEQRCIDGYGACVRGIGFNTEVRAGSSLGVRRSEETCIKQRTRQREPFSDETKAKMRASAIGRRFPLAVIEAKSKLTLAKADEIRRLVASNTRPQTEIARMFGVSDATVSMIVAGKRWPHAVE